MTRSTPLGDLQLAILRVLWMHGEATVSDVHSALLEARGLAPTTIATMLTKMEKRGLVSHRSEGRRYIYRSLLTEEQATESMVSDLTTRMFGGNVADLVSHLIEQNQFGADELAELNRVISDAEKKERS